MHAILPGTLARPLLTHHEMHLQFAVRCCLAVACMHMGIGMLTSSVVVCYNQWQTKPRGSLVSLHKLWCWCAGFTSRMTHPGKKFSTADLPDLSPNGRLCKLFSHTRIAGFQTTATALHNHSLIGLLPAIVMRCQRPCSTVTPMY